MLYRLLLLYLAILNPVSARIGWASNIKASTKPHELPEKIILFNEVSKVLMTEKIHRVDFLVQFPNREFTEKPDNE